MRIIQLTEGKYKDYYAIQKGFIYKKYLDFEYGNGESWWSSRSVWFKDCVIKDYEKCLEKMPLSFIGIIKWIFTKHKIKYKVVYKESDYIVNFLKSLFNKK